MSLASVPSWSASSPEKQLEKIYGFDLRNIPDAA